MSEKRSRRQAGSSSSKAQESVLSSLDSTPGPSLGGILVKMFSTCIPYPSLLIASTTSNSQKSIPTAF